MVMHPSMYLLWGRHLRCVWGGWWALGGNLAKYRHCHPSDRGWHRPLLQWWRWWWWRYATMQPDYGTMQLCNNATGQNNRTPVGKRQCSAVFRYRAAWLTAQYEAPRCKVGGGEGGLGLHFQNIGSQDLMLGAYMACWTTFQWITPSSHVNRMQPMNEIWQMLLFSFFANSFPVSLST